MKQIPMFAVLTALAFLTACAHSSEAAPAPAEAQSTEPAYLFVQNAQGVESGDGTLTLKGVSPTTVYFSDRPQRGAGHGKTSDFIKMWDEGTDSFQSDPPNATVSIYDEGDNVTDVVLTLNNPRMQGQDLIYDVQILDGELPATGGPAALFIDMLIISRPPVVVTPRVVVRRPPIVVYRPHPVVVY